jgi:hypothetical protein
MNTKKKEQNEAQVDLATDFEVKAGNVLSNP